MVCKFFRFFEVMKSQFLLFLFLAFGLTCFAQKDYEYVKSNRFEYADKVYDPNIKTVMLHHSTGETLPPIITLGGNETLTLKFDLLSEDIGDFSYKVIHCDANWQPDDLAENLYLDGFNGGLIQDYELSFSTLQPYIHYKLEFPNFNLTPKASGNYLLVVYDDYDEEKTVLTRRFMVVERKVGINPKITKAVEIVERDMKQRVTFSLDHSALDVNNPLAEIKVVVRQNRRWDNAKTNLRPRLIQEEKLVFDDNDGCVFYAGNEFRFFDLRSVRFQSERIANIRKDSIYKAFLSPDRTRQFEPYQSFQDENGNYFIRKSEGYNPDLEADYVNVVFTYPRSIPFTSGPLFLFGSFSDWRIHPDFKMDFKDGVGVYTKTVMLKQGYYNYAYGIPKGGMAQLSLSETEGDFFDAENEYMIQVYFKGVSDRYDRLVGVSRFSSVDFIR